MSAPYAVFPHVEGNWSADEQALQRELARIMVTSARAAMPGVKVKMLTDHATPAIEGVDEVLRRPMHGWQWIPWVCDFCSKLDGEVLYFDTDVVIQKDLRGLFNVPADIVLPYRGPKTVDGRQMPFLFGVVAYRKREIWDEVRDRVLAMPEVEQKWYGSQIATFEMWMEENNGRGKWKISSVPCSEYNYTPRDAHEEAPEKWMLHYKGRKRKTWMLAKWGHLLEQKAAA